MIAVPDMLSQMERLDQRGQPIPFSIDFVTANLDKGTGGDVMRYEHAHLCFPNASGTRKFTPSRKIAAIQQLIKQGRSPDHVRNGTINIITPGNQVTTVSIWLIRYFNNEKVIWHIHG